MSLVRLLFKYWLILLITGSAAYLITKYGKQVSRTVTYMLGIPKDIPKDERTPYPHIVINKGSRTLDLYSNGNLIRKYKIGLGFNPVGKKTKEGDGKTPEGNYYVCNKNPYSLYHLSLGVSYPNDEDAKQGVLNNLITQKEYNDILNSIRNKSTPPWNTKLGGEIFIHGDGASKDWTAGCVALDNNNIEQLYSLVPVGTPVTIKQ